MSAELDHAAVITAVALLALTGVASANENWVCGIPTLVDPAHINLFDFDRTSMPAVSVSAFGGKADIPDRLTDVR